MATKIYTMSNPNMMSAMGCLDSADLAERLGLDKNVDKTTFLTELHKRFDAGRLDDQPTLKLMATLIDRGLMMDYVNGAVVKVEWPEPKADPLDATDAIAAHILSLIDANDSVDPDDDCDDEDDYEGDEDDEDADYDYDEEDEEDDDSHEYSPSYRNPVSTNSAANPNSTDSTDSANNTDSARSTETNADDAPDICVRIHASSAEDELDAKVKAVIDLIDKMVTLR